MNGCSGSHYYMPYNNEKKAGAKAEVNVDVYHRCEWVGLTGLKKIIEAENYDGCHEKSAAYYKLFPSIPVLG